MLLSPDPVALAISFTSCTFFDQSQTYFFAMLGIIGSMTLGQPALEEAQNRLRMARLAQSVARPRDPVVAAESASYGLR